MNIAQALSEVNDRITTMESKYNGGIPAFLYSFITNDMMPWVRDHDDRSALTAAELEEVRQMGFIVTADAAGCQRITLPIRGPRVSDFEDDGDVTIWTIDRWPGMSIPLGYEAPVFASLKSDGGGGGAFEASIMITAASGDVYDLDEFPLETVWKRVRC